MNQKEFFMVDRFERFSFAISEISKNWHKIVEKELETFYEKVADWSEV